MAYKKICNRCGIEMPKGTDNELHFTEKRNTRYGYDELIHLCDDCLEKFDEFMMEKNKK